MTTFAVARLFVLVFASAIIATTAYFVPGVNPHSYKEGEMYVYVAASVSVAVCACMKAI